MLPSWNLVLLVEEPCLWLKFGRRNLFRFRIHYLIV